MRWPRCASAACRMASRPNAGSASSATCSGATATSSAVWHESAGTLDKDAISAWVRRSAHPKAGLELRELFASMTRDTVGDMLAAIDRGPPTELAASVGEAIEVMPFLADRLEVAAASPDERV